MPNTLDQELPVGKLLDRAVQAKEDPAVNPDRAIADIRACVSRLDSRLNVWPGPITNAVGGSYREVFIQWDVDTLATLRVTTAVDGNAFDPSYLGELSYSDDAIEAAVRVGLQQLEQQIQLEGVGSTYGGRRIQAR